jgi:hypothetical protein
MRAGGVMTGGAFSTAFLVGLAWVMLVLAVSLIVRRRRGQPILRPAFPDALYVERWASGHSLRNVVTRLGRASGCLWVAVTPDALHVGLHFPFNLAFLGEIYRLEHRVDVRDVRAVETSRSLLGRRAVRVRFARADGGDETIELQVADPDALTAALAAARERIK